MSAVARRFHEHGLGPRTGLRIGEVARDEYGAEDLDAFFLESKRVLDGLDDLHATDSDASTSRQPTPDSPAEPVLGSGSMDIEQSSVPSPRSTVRAQARTRQERVSDFPRAPDTSMWDSTYDVSREKTFDLMGLAGDDPNVLHSELSGASFRSSLPSDIPSFLRDDASRLDSTRAGSRDDTLRYGTSRLGTPQGPDQTLRADVAAGTPQLSRIDDTLQTPNSDVPSFLRPEASVSRVDMSQLMYGDNWSWEISEADRNGDQGFGSDHYSAPSPASLDAASLDAASQDAASELGFDAAIEPDIHSLRATPEVEAAPIVPKKRGRGRPRKSETLRAAAAAAAAGLAVPKRPVGRPPGRQMAPQRIVEKIYDPPAWQISEHGLRRGKRHRIRPLDWWRGERALYGRDGDNRDSDKPLMPFGIVAPVLKEVIRVPRAPGEGTFAGMRRVKTQPGTYAHPGRPLGSRNFASQTSEDVTGRIRHPEDGWDEATDPIGHVIDAEKGTEVPMRIACTADSIRPRQAFNQSFSYEKLFGVGEFMAAGILVIPVDGDKPTKPSKDNSYVRIR